MPRYTVHVRGEWLAVPCKDGQLTVGWLGREAVRRYMKNKPDNGGFASVDEVRFLMRRCKGLGLLDNDDPLQAAQWSSKGGLLRQHQHDLDLVRKADLQSPSQPCRRRNSRPQGRGIRR